MKQIKFVQKDWEYKLQIMELFRNLCKIKIWNLNVYFLNKVKGLHIFFCIHSP